MTDVKVLFGRRLKSLRKGRGLTQEALGKLSKLDYKHIWSIEKGINAPSFEAIAKLARALRVEPFELFLPERLSSGLVDQHIQQVISGFDKLDPSAVKDFFGDLLVALRKMESGKSRSSPAASLLAPPYVRPSKRFILLYNPIMKVDLQKDLHLGKH